MATATYDPLVCSTSTGAEYEYQAGWSAAYDGSRRAKLRRLEADSKGGLVAMVALIVASLAVLVVLG